MDPIRIAMWSGPRNISTAMMRSFGSRDDTFVSDEPLYAHYLVETGSPHPGREEIICSQSTDWNFLTSWLTGPVPDGKRIWYQKQMAHHLPPDRDLDWTLNLINCFLIRHPRDVVVSYLKVNPLEKADELGFSQQKVLFDFLKHNSDEPILVLDSDEVLDRPREALKALCRSIGIPFQRSMLSWPKGIQPGDGVWAKYWYGNLIHSTTFLPRKAVKKKVPAPYRAIFHECLPFYEELHAHRLQF